MTKPNLDPENRLGYKGDLEQFIDSASVFFRLGRPSSKAHLNEGYEDCNIKVSVDGKNYVCKIFADNQLGDYSKTRRGSDVADRLVNIIQAVSTNGVNTVKLLQSQDGSILYRNDGLVALMYGWIDGATYYDLKRAPTSHELEEIIKQVSLIHTTPFKPEYYHDIWAVPHIQALHDKMYAFLSDNDKRLSEFALAKFNAIHLSKLPQCLVHGDLTKGNVIVGDSSLPTLIDFSVTNWTTRIIELVLIISNLMHDNKDSRTLSHKTDDIISLYEKYGTLTSEEKTALPDLCVAGAAMELLGGRWRQEFLSDDSDETQYWIDLGRKVIEDEVK